MLNAFFTVVVTYVICKLMLLIVESGARGKIIKGETVWVVLFSLYILATAIVVLAALDLFINQQLPSNKGSF